MGLICLVLTLGKTPTNINVGEGRKPSRHLLAFNSSHKPHFQHTHQLYLTQGQHTALEITALAFELQRKHWLGDALL